MKPVASYFILSLPAAVIVSHLHTAVSLRAPWRSVFRFASWRGADVRTRGLLREQGVLPQPGNVPGADRTGVGRRLLLAVTRDPPSAHG